MNNCYYKKKKYGPLEPGIDFQYPLHYVSTSVCLKAARISVKKNQRFCTPISI